MIRLPEIKTAELSTYGNFAMCHLFRVPREGLGTRLSPIAMANAQTSGNLIAAHGHFLSENGVFYIVQF